MSADQESREPGPNRVRVDIYGQDYALKGQATVEYLRRVARLVDEQMREIGEQNPRLDYSRIAVLAAVNIADRYLRLCDEYEDLLRSLERESEPRIREES
ncbi:MAG: cell division protein ZapA [Kyrpidia sp.]|nr:cell division protein ZapA [Kyrpidia sp.]